MAGPPPLQNLAVTRFSSFLLLCVQLVPKPNLYTLKIYLYLPFRPTTTILVKTTQSLIYVTVTLPSVFCFYPPFHTLPFVSLVPKQSSSNANLILLHQNFKVFTIFLIPAKSSVDLSVWHTQLSKAWVLCIFSPPFPVYLPMSNFQSYRIHNENPYTHYSLCCHCFIPFPSFVDPIHLIIVQMAPPLWMLLFLPLVFLRVDFFSPFFTALIAWTFILLLNMLFSHYMLIHLSFF